MRTHPTTVWAVCFTNAEGIPRRHVFFTPHHAEQYARAMRSCPHVSDVRIEESNPVAPTEIDDGMGGTYRPGVILHHS